MEKQELRDLFARYLEDRLSPEEVRTLLRHLGEEQAAGDVRALLREAVSRLGRQDFSDARDLEPVFDRVYQRILAATGEDPLRSDSAQSASSRYASSPSAFVREAPPARESEAHAGVRVKRTFLLRVAASAALLALLGAGSYFLFFRSSIRPDSIHQTMSHTNDILPGGNRAVLTLGDGTRLALDEAGIGELAEQSGIQISKTRDGIIVYDASSPAAPAGVPVSYNTISTPPGGQYRVILPDGTQVWLNAASTLRYPAVFRGNDRKVELAGEAYFEVAHDKSKPFIVKTLDQEIQVLGTHFNVKAYADESETRTTLLEGAVRITVGANTRLLHPGQQAQVISGQNDITVSREANTDAAVAWKNGKFIFEGERIESIMKRISRWYNAEIVYQGDVTDNEFIGTISRFENVSEVLSLLELTGTVHFRIEAEASSSIERRIIVMP